MLTPVLLITSNADHTLALTDHFPSTTVGGWRLYNTVETPLTVDAARQVLNQLEFAPGAGTTYVAFIGAENLSVVIQNTLLKTLEEPPSNVQLALVSADLSPMLPTVVSRCVVVNLDNAAAPTPEATAELAQLYQTLKTQSIAAAITLADKTGSDRPAALGLIDSLISYIASLNQAQPSAAHVTDLNQLLITRQQLQANVHVKLALEGCFFALRGRV